jgi:hypothetical protein
VTALAALVARPKSPRVRASFVYFVMAEVSFIPSAVAILYHAVAWLVVLGYGIAMASVGLNYMAHREKERA